MNSPYLNIRELGKRIKISQWTIYRWASDRYLPSIKIGGRILFDWNAIQNWLTQNSRKLSQSEREDNTDASRN